MARGVLWQIGNEPDLNGLFTPASYAQTLMTYVTAMKAVDPTIKIVGGVLLTGEDVMGQHDSPDWLTPMLDTLKAGGGAMDVFDWHYYPLYSSPNSATSTSSSTPTIAHLLQEDAQDWPPAGLDFADTVMPYLAQMKAKYPAQSAQCADLDRRVRRGPRQHPGGRRALRRQRRGPVAADALGRYMDYGIGAIFKFIYKTTSQYKYTLIDENYQPRPEYYAYWLYAQHFGDQMVAAKVDQRWAVAAHAAVRAADGSLRIMLVNKQSTDQRVRLTLADFKPRAAGQFLYKSDGYSSTNVSLNGQQLSMANIGQANTAIAAANADGLR